MSVPEGFEPRRGRVWRGFVAFVLLAGVLGAAAFLVIGRPDPTPSTPDTTAAAATDTTELGRASAERQSALVADEDERLLTLVASQTSTRGGAYDQTVGDVDTLVLTAGSAYQTQDLIDLGALVQEPDGVLLLVRSVFVAPGARLNLEAPAATLRMSSGTMGFTSIVAWKATLSISGADGAPLTVTSWDTALNSPDISPVDGRAYVRDVSGEMDVEQVAFDSLGFWAGRTSGVAWTGSTSDDSSGSITDSTFAHSHYGAFASRVRGLEVEESAFTDNSVDGLSLHRGSAEITVVNSRAERNGQHGFAADLGSESVTYTDVVASSNLEAGISFSGTPLAEGQTANGASLRTYGNVQVEGGLVEGNGGAGIRVVDANDVLIEGTQVIDNRDGVMLRGTTAPTTVTGTTVRGGHRYGITVRNGTAEVTGNDVSDATTAIRVQDAEVAVADNTVRTSTNHAVSVVGAATGSSVIGNHVSGQGPSALDLYRVTDGVDVELSGNDSTGWIRDRDNYTYWTTFVPTHPMLVLWVVLLGVPLVLTLRARGIRLAPGTLPYRDGRREWQPARVYAGRPIDLGPTMAGGGQA